MNLLTNKKYRVTYLYSIAATWIWLFILWFLFTPGGNLLICVISGLVPSIIIVSMLQQHQPFVVKLKVCAVAILLSLLGFLIIAPIALLLTIGIFGFPAQD
jgi:hypothetical protein